MSREAAPMRIALLTLPALASVDAVRRFIAAHAAEIALVGLSDPFRPGTGGALGQFRRRVMRSGPRLVPYLLANFALPALPLPGRRAPPLASACRALGLPTLVVSDVNGSAFREALAASGAEILLTFHFDQILSAETIASVPAGGINVHPGLLPAHRGPVPTIHALLDEPVRLGVSVHRLAPRIDAGALLAQAALPDAPGLTALRAARLLHEAALPLLDEVLADLRAGRARERSLPVLPYRPFPSPAEMRRLSASGRRAADRRDLWDALRTSA